MKKTPSTLSTKIQNRMRRVDNACRSLVVASSNLLPYRLCQTLRQALLQIAGVKFGGKCKIRGPFYVQYPTRLSIGAGTIINGHSHFENAERIDIGRDCSIGPGLMVFTMNHYGNFPRSNEPSPVTIGQRVLFGGAVRVVPGVTIGDDCVVGAGSVVIRNVRAGETVFGVPARPTNKATVITV